MPSKSFATITKDLSAAMMTLRKEIPDTMQGFSAMHNGAMKGGALSELDKELLALAIGVGLAAHGVLVDHHLRLRGEGVGGRLVGLGGEVLVTVDVPAHHHEEHDHAPHERDRDPGAFDAIDRVLPPQSFGRR